MSRFEGDSTEIPGIGDLPRALAPRRDPWPRIERRIASASGAEGPARRAGNGWRLTAVAASLLAAVLVVMLMLSRQGPDPAGRTDQLASAGTSEPRTTGVPVSWPAQAGLVQGSESEYRGALVEFRSVVAGGPVDGEPASMGSLSRGWAELAAAERELMRALRDYPQNSYINERLVQLRARQVDVLRQIAAADMALRRRTI